MHLLCFTCPFHQAQVPNDFTCYSSELSARSVVSLN